MIAQLRGRVAHRATTHVVVDVGGVGYLVQVTPGERIPPRGEVVELHTSLQVREDSMTLYGFTDRAALALFELLLTSSGVGPRIALAAIGTHRPDVLRTAIAGGDIATLTTISGVGKKVAERLVLELKDKVGAATDGALPTTAPASGAEGAALGEVRDALLGLGYSAGEVQRALAAVRADAADAGDGAAGGVSGDGAAGGVSGDADAGGAAAGDDTSTLLRRALRHLAASAYDGAR